MVDHREMHEQCLGVYIYFMLRQRSRALTNITLRSSTIWAEPSHAITVFEQPNA